MHVPAQPHTCPRKQEDRAKTPAQVKQWHAAGKGHTGAYICRCCESGQGSSQTRQIRQQSLCIHLKTPMSRVLRGSTAFCTARVHGTPGTRVAQAQGHVCTTKRTRVAQSEGHVLRNLKDTFCTISRTRLVQSQEDVVHNLKDTCCAISRTRVAPFEGRVLHNLNDTQMAC